MYIKSSRVEDITVQEKIIVNNVCRNNQELTPNNQIWNQFNKVLKRRIIFIRQANLNLLEIPEMCNLQI